MFNMGIGGKLATVRPLWGLGFFLWFLVLGAGFHWLWSFSTTAGKPAQPPESWPAQSSLPLGNRAFTMVLFLHSECSCSQATLEELSRLLVRTKDRMDVYAVLFRPGSQESAMERQLARLPVRVVFDTGGVAQRFGVATSGQVLLYDDGGRLQFAGGITPGRGHQGDNAGLDSLRAILARRGPGNSTTPVYGCGLCGR